MPVISTWWHNSVTGRPASGRLNNPRIRSSLNLLFLMFGRPLAGVTSVWLEYQTGEEGGDRSYAP